MDDVSSGESRCGIILAAGEGRRLESLVHQLRGDTLPKQYVNFTGTRSMLEHTFLRAEMLIPQERLFTVVSEGHLDYPAVLRQLSSRPPGTVIAQPQNRDTGPGVLLPLMHLYKSFPESTVAIFPSDHFIGDESLFVAYVSLAFRAVEREPSGLVLLGIAPDDVEPEYGYILPDGTERSLKPLGVRRVSRFVEKPAPSLARELMVQGGLWNTMVTVCRTKTLLELMGSIAPELCRRFRQILPAIGTNSERQVATEVYRELEAMNFSREFLAVLPLRHPGRLHVLPVRGVSWSDWGLPRYVQSVLEKIAYAGSPAVQAQFQRHDSAVDVRAGKAQ